jgi:FixJ family two-component response regulator
MTAEPGSSRRRVHVIDDDDGLRAGLANLLRSSGLDVATFSSPRAFLDGLQPNDRGCLLLDIQFPGTNGLDFQTELLASDCAMPVIIMTGHADVASSIRGMKSGAADFLVKPFDDADLLAAVAAALEREELLWLARVTIRDATDRYASLTSRERQVFALVTAGLMNKQVAFDLGLSEITVKTHRGTMMRKMNARTLPDLVRIAETLKLRRPPPAA